VTHPGDGLRVVILIKHLHRLPCETSKVVVDGVHKFEDLVGVGLIDAQVTSGRYEELNKVHLAAQL
jgi:hypothetical protein